MEEDLYAIFKGEETSPTDSTNTNPKPKTSKSTKKQPNPQKKTVKLNSRLSALIGNKITKFENKDTDKDKTDQNNDKNSNKKLLTQPKQIRAQLTKNSYKKKKDEKKQADKNLSKNKLETIQEEGVPKNSKYHRVNKGGKDQMERIFSKKATQVTKIRLNGNKHFQERYSGKINSLKRNFTVNGQKKIFQKYVDNSADANINMLADCEVNLKSMAETTEVNTVTKDNLYLRFMSESVRWLLLEDRNASAELITLKNKRLSEIVKFDKDKQKTLLEEKGYQKIAKEFFGFDTLYNFQTEALCKLEGSKKAVLVNSFTGSGKSLIYQFNAIVREGLTIVIAPYISIIIDQISKAPKNLPVLALNSWLSFPQKQEFFRLIKTRKIKMVFITPEMFLSVFYLFILKNPEIKISLVCVDETHCAVPWDPSFRMSYIAIKNAIDNFKRLHPDLNTLFLTATIDKGASEFLRKEFTIKSEDVIENRNYLQSNIDTHFSEVSDQNKKILELVKNKYAKKKPILVFCNFKKSTEILAHFLKINGVKAFCFHSGLTEIDKLTILENLGKDKPTNNNTIININEVDVIITTVSLSMGLNIPNIKGIVHYNFPQIIENYIQQIGRSGRNGEKSECEVMLNAKDYYFVRGKTISGCLVNRKNLEKFLEKIFEVDNGYYFITNDDALKDFGMSKEEFGHVLGVIKMAVSETDQLSLKVNYNFRNRFKIKKPRDKKILKFIEKKFEEWKDDENVKEADLIVFKEIYDTLKKSCKITKDGLITGTLADMANRLKLDIEELVCQMENLCDALDICFMQDSWGIHLKLSTPPNTPKPQIQDFSKLVAEKLNRLLKIKLNKIDVFFALSNYLNTKENSTTSKERFTELVSLYFNNVDDDLWKTINKEVDLKSFCPLIFTTKDEGFQDVKETFAEFFAHNYDVIVDLLKYGEPFKVFADVARFVLGVTSDYFRFKKWHKSESWGCLECYSIENHFDYFFVLCYDFIVTFLLLIIHAFFAYYLIPTQHFFRTR